MPQTYPNFNPQVSGPVAPLTDLQQAQTTFAHGVRQQDGTVCPICHRWARVHRRRITAGAARTAAWLFKYHQQAWVHVAAVAPKKLIENREYNRLAYWGLLEPQPNVTDPSKRTSGIWRLTDAGMDWVQQRLTLPEWIEVYDNTVISRAPALVPFAAAMGNHFDYQDFMANL